MSQFSPRNEMIGKLLRVPCTPGHIQSGDEYLLGERLRGVRLAPPFEDFAQQRQAAGALLEVLRFVVETPEQDAVVVAERRENVFDVAFEAGPRSRIVDRRGSGALYPLRVVDALDRLGLFAQLRVFEPAAVGEEGHDGLDSVVAADSEECVDALLESGGIGLPHHVVQEDADRVEPEFLGLGHLVVDGLRIEALRLPHFELVDGRGRDVVEAHGPLLLRIPGVGTLLRPALCRSRSRGLFAAGGCGEERDRAIDD